MSALAELIAALPADLRAQALRHATWTEVRIDSFERLAFLGDSVLGLAMAAEISARFPDVTVGGLTKIFNQAVSGLACAAVGRELGVPEMLREAEPDDIPGAIPAETLIGGERPLPEVTEALIGACFLAFGFDRTAAAVVDAFEQQVHAAEHRVDFKTALQELLAQRGARVFYKVVKKSGPPHQRIFEVAAIVNRKRVGEGVGRSKKAAEQAAAERALARLSA